MPVWATIPLAAVFLIASYFFFRWMDSTQRSGIVGGLRRVEEESQLGWQRDADRQHRGARSARREVCRQRCQRLGRSSTRVAVPVKLIK
jgi:hypothetical protein